MAFSEAEKSRIRRYLGYSELFKDRDKRLEGQMDALDASAPTAVTQVQTLLTQLASIDARILSYTVGGMLYSSLNRGEVVYADNDRVLTSLQDSGRSLIQQISITFEVYARRDFYGTGETGGEIRLG